MIGYGVYYIISTPEFKKYMVEIGLGGTYPIELSGTGSMYPTFPKGVGKTYQELSKESVATASMYKYPTGFVFNNKPFYQYSLNDGDIVSFKNDITKSIIQSRGGDSWGFVKRIVGIAGDKIEIRDGSLMRNKKAIAEPYIARARSTFGGTFLRDCKEIIVPENKILVMGDNRKGSNDSRFQLGFVSLGDVDFVLPLDKQVGKYDKYWRDTSSDQSDSAKIHLDKQKLVDLINKKRQDSKLKMLKYNVKLEKAAEKRGTYMISSDDFSSVASGSGYTMKKALKEVGYSNIILAEAPIQGYYEYDEIYDSLFEFDTRSSFLLEKDFDDIGIAEVDGKINDCPTRVIVIDVGGYRPPNYSAEYKDSWNKVLKNLVDVQPSWERLKDYPIYNTNKKEVDRLLQILKIRIDALQSIVASIEKNQWFSDEQNLYIAKETDLQKEQQDLIERLLKVLSDDH